MPAALVLGLLLFYYLHAYAQRAAERSFDNLLAASALSIADAIQYEEGAPTVELPYSSLAILASRTSSRVFYRVTAPDRTLITGYSDLAPDVVAATSSEPRFTNGTFLDVTVRICSLGRFVSGGQQSGWVTILVAQTNEDRRLFAGELLRFSFGPALAIMLLAPVLVFFAVRGALRPLDDIEQAITTNDPASLKVLEVTVPREIHHLVSALNAMIIKVTALLSRMQDFIAESAHQIRTPLSNLRAQVEVAMDATDRRAVDDHLRTIHRNAVVVSRLANQLLADTMVAHRGEITSLQPIDLLEFAELVTEEFAERTGAKVALRTETVHAALYVLGDALMLAEALKNLLDNALKYGGAAEPITVRVETEGAEAVLSVEDRGPGIALAERGGITERFVRGSRTGETPGSGLGLAIVANVVRHHGGKLVFDDGEDGGLTVRVILPLATATAEDAK